MGRPYAVILPGGLFLLAALALLRPGSLPDSMGPYVRAYPYVVAGTGVFLGWLFNRSRVVFAIVVLALSDRGLLQFATRDAMAAGVGRTVFDAVSILLPLNLVAFGMISERGILNVRGLARLVAILVQCLIVAFIGLPALRDVAVGLEYKFVNGNLLSWTPLPQPALLAFSVAVVVQGIRVILHRSAIEGGFLWALVASFVALHGSRAGWLATNYFATAGLILVVALFETSYRMAYHRRSDGAAGAASAE